MLHVLHVCLWRGHQLPWLPAEGYEVNTVHVWCKHVGNPVQDTWERT